MTLTALVVLLQVAAATPTPTPAASPVPTPKKTPVAAAGYGTGKSLSDVARERKLQKEKGGEPPKAPGFTLAPAAGGIGGAGKPVAEPVAPPETDTAPGPAPLVRVESAQHNDQVGSGGQVRVYGTVRNTGATAACDVVVNVRLYDDKSRYLVSGSGRIDDPRLPSGERSSYSVTVQVPQGVAGSGKQMSLNYGGTSGGGVTLEGSWRMLGRVEAEVVSVAEACPGEKPAGKPAPAEEAPAEKPTAPPG